MFKGLAITAVTVLAASNAYASKARMAALGQSTNIGSQYIMDSRNVFHNPAYVNGMGGMFQVEFGAPAQDNTGAAPNVEGGFYQKAGESTFGLWLGNDNAVATGQRTALNTAATTTFLMPDNTFELFYGGSGAMDWGVSFNYSSSADKDVNNDGQQSVMGLRGGVSTEQFDVGLVLGLANTAQYDDGTEQKFAGTMGALLTAGYNLEAGKVFFNYQMGGFTLESGGTAVDAAKNDSNALGLGYTRNWSMDKGLFFYAVEYRSTSSKTGSADAETAGFIPVTIGVETEAASWLVLRGSIVQNVLVNSEAQGSATNHIPDTTVASVGAGLNFEGIMIDGVLTAGRTGELSFGGASPLMGQVSMTYNF